MEGKMQGKMPAAAPESAPEGRGRRTVALIVGILVIIAVVVIGWLLFLTVGRDLIGGGQAVEPQQLVRMQGDLVLRPADLPYAYFVESGDESRYGNAQLIGERGELEGKAYVTATGRVDGWKIRLKRTNKSDITPAVYENTVEIFESREGAELALSPEWFKAYSDPNNPTIEDDNCGLGSECILYSYENFDPATGLTTLRYDVAYVYRNVLVWVSGRGLDVEMNPESVLETAQIVLDKLEAAAQ